MNLTDDRDVCGYGMISLPPDHPFTPACRRHDYWFTQKQKKIETPGRRRVDDQLLKDMLYIADVKESFSLRMQAYAYYFIARAAGKIFWET